MIAWFAGEFGFDEEGVLNKDGFNAVQEKFKLEEEQDGELVLESKENMQRFHVGKFELPSLINLRERLRKLTHASLSQPDVPERESAGEREEDSSGDKRRSTGEVFSGSRRELLRQDSSRDERSGLTFFNVAGDARELHLEAGNAEAVFQVASQFNCLEMVDPKEKPEYGVTQYCLDHTQGPACAMACPAATVFRNYFVPVEHMQSADAKREWTGQQNQIQLDTTCEVAELINNRDKQVADCPARCYALSRY
eukprot:137530-Rhodomonas_salina.1